MNPLLQLHALGQRIWLDNLSRTLLREGTLKKLIAEDGVAGVTSNPSIFFKAISESPYYRDEAAALRRDATLTPEQRYERLAIADIQAACDLLRPLFDQTAATMVTSAWKSLPRSRMTPPQPSRRPGASGLR